MGRMTLVSAVSCLLVALPAGGQAPAAKSAAAAQPAPVKRVIRLTPKNTTLKFQAYSRLVDADGKFGKFAGTVALTGTDPKTAKLKVAVEITSLNTGIDKRDSHLRTADFFNVKKWPKAVFTSTAIKASGKDRYEVRGTLNMMGKKMPIKFLADMVVGKDGKLRARADFRLDRRRWGMSGYMSSWGVNPIKATVRVHFQVKE